MTKRIALFATLILSLVLLPGCPGGVPSALVGSWIITSGGDDSGLQLNANGEAIPFFIDSKLTGVLTWEADGTRVLIHQVIVGEGTFIYAAFLTSDTTMSGASVGWEGSVLGLSNTFTAVKQ